LVLAMVLLERPVRPDGLAVLARLQAHTGTRYQAKITSSTGDEVATLAVDGDDMVAISLMPVPIPWSELEGPCTTTNWLWPRAEQECRRAKAHHVVALSTTSTDRIGARLKLTDAVAADVAATGALGVYWGAGVVVASADAFLAAAARASRDELPLPLWVTVHVQRAPSGASFFATQGATDLGFMEVEFERATDKPLEDIDRMLVFLHYLCDRGAVIGDGDTFGRTATERIYVRHAPSKWKGRGTVYRLDF